MVETFQTQYYYMFVEHGIFFAIPDLRQNDRDVTQGLIFCLTTPIYKMVLNRTLLDATVSVDK